MTKILLAIMFAGLLFTITARSEDTLYWMKIDANNKEERTLIANTGAVIESVMDDYVVVVANATEKALLEKLRNVRMSFALTPEMFDFPEKDSRFHNYDELHAAITEMKTKASDIVEIEVIGKSVEGRDITNIKLTAPSDIKEIAKPAILFTGTHHAREHLSTEIPLMLAQYLVAEYLAGNDHVIKLLESTVVNIIPLVNPDGSEYDIADGRYKMWRKNRSVNSNGTFGVDLNRNYGYGWGGEGASASPGSDTYRGPEAFSEPETQAIKDFVESRKNITTLLSFHTFSKLILYPWGHKYESIQDEADRKVHETMARTMAQWNGYKPQEISALYIASGDTTDWSYGEHKIISFTFELDPSTMWEGGFYPGQGVIDSVFAKNLKPALYLIENTPNPYQVIEPTHKKLGFTSALPF